MSHLEARALIVRAINDWIEKRDGTLRKDMNIIKECIGNLHDTRVGSTNPQRMGGTHRDETVF